MFRGMEPVLTRPCEDRSYNSGALNPGSLTCSASSEIHPVNYTASRNTHYFSDSRLSHISTYQKCKTCFLYQKTAIAQRQH
ncbi:Serum Paraoxonase/Arylesterase 2 [Manis pentadactyla]|nr:Serum Paraoxonase/Arylesterase 2 [Manis pentadactyla]